MAKDFSEHYSNEYFANRHLSDPKRIISFKQEKDFIFKHISDGRVCDVGCATGEFLDFLQWPGERFGMEIIPLAIEEAKKRQISFERDITNSSNFFDLVIFRGTIQHLPHPIYMIEKAFDSLKPGGYVCFTATPNANSIYYKLFNTLPMLTPARNFYIPSDITLSNILTNFGFTNIIIEYPYWNSPYAAPLRDHILFITKFLFRTNAKFPFWRNMMNIIAKKPT